MLRFLKEELGFKSEEEDQERGVCKPPAKPSPTCLWGLSSGVGTCIWEITLMLACSSRGGTRSRGKYSLRKKGLGERVFCPCRGNSVRKKHQGGLSTRNPGEREYPIKVVGCGAKR